MHGYEELPVYNQSGKVTVANNGSLILKLPANDTEGWAKYGGIYRCYARNGYSQDMRQATIHVAGIDLGQLTGNNNTVRPHPCYVRNCVWSLCSRRICD